MYIVLYRTTAKCATQCTAKIFFARIATSNTAYPVHNPTRKLQHHQSMYGRNIFRPKRNQQHRIPVRNPNRQPQHHLPTCGRNIFRPYRNQQHRVPVRNPIRKPQHHLPTCERKIFRPHDILPIRLTSVRTQPFCPTPPVTIGARCAGATRPRPPQRLYLAKSI